jgi:hypothetical protein
MKAFFTILLASLFSTWMFSKAKNTEPKKVDGVWILSPVIGVSLIMLMGVLLGLGFIFFGFWGPPAERNIVVIGGGCFVVFAITAWPKSVYVGQDGLAQRSWYGRWKQIGWHSIRKVKILGDKSIAVRGDSMQIVLTKSHAGYEFFLQTLHEHGKY